MPAPNIQINWIENSTEQNRIGILLKKHRITSTDGSGFQFIKFDFVRGCQEIKTTHTF